PGPPASRLSPYTTLFRSDMGPLLLSRMLGLNETQQGVLQLGFKIADERGLLQLDAKDLRAMLQYVGEHAREFTTEYGNVSSASIDRKSTRLNSSHVKISY